MKLSRSGKVVVWTVVGLIGVTLTVSGIIATGAYQTGTLKNQLDCNSLVIIELQHDMVTLNKNVPNDLDKRLRCIENALARIEEKVGGKH